MKQYLDLLSHVMKHGARKEDRTGTGTISTFGYQMRFSLEDGFPLLTTKRLHLKSIMAVPFRSGGKTIGALYLDNRFRTANFTDEDERLLELFADQAVAAIGKAALVRELRSKTAELEEHYRQQKAELKKRGSELRFAQRELKQHRKARGWGFDKIVARSVSMQGILRDLMDDMRAMGYPTAFTLARASVPGINLAFQRLGFGFRGRMASSCRIGGGIEDIEAGVVAEQPYRIRRLILNPIIKHLKDRHFIY